MTQINPFIIEGYIAPEYFCDRKEETTQLINHINNQRNVALIAKRRLGKSGLIHNMFFQTYIKENYYTFYIDIYDTKNLAEFTDALGKAVLEALKPFGRKVWEGFLSLLHSVRSAISFDINGTPQWTLSVGKIQRPDILLDEIFNYLSQADKPCIVAIDEFQVIADYPEKTVEATLRKHIQNCHNAHFIYSGSKRHMMSEMFLSQSRPFYNSSALMGLDPINKELYLDFANKHLSSIGRSITPQAFSKLYDTFDGTTWYIQYVLNILYASREDAIYIKEETIEAAISTIINQNSFAYRSILFQLAPKQKQVFKAIASEGKVRSAMSQEFLKKHSLTASTVQGAIKVLLDRDLLTYEDDTYYVYDRFFEKWLNL